MCDVCDWLLRTDEQTQGIALLLIEDQESERQTLLWVLMSGRGFDGTPADIKGHLEDC